jgi:hypothetical protein
MDGYNNAEKAISELCRVKQKGLMSTKKTNSAEASKSE